MSSPDFDISDAVANLAQVVEPTFDIDTIANPGIWDARGLAVGKIKGLAQEAAIEEAFTLSADEDGELTQTAKICDYSSSARPPLCDLSLSYEKGRFSGIALDLTAAGRGRYRLGLDGALAYERNGEFMPMGMLRSRLFYGRINRYMLF